MEMTAADGAERGKSDELHPPHLLVVALRQAWAAAEYYDRAHITEQVQKPLRSLMVPIISGSLWDSEQAIGNKPAERCELRDYPPGGSFDRNATCSHQ